MAHDHHHHDDNYYVDQLCMIALCGAYGAVALAMYFWNRPMLGRLVGSQFHDYILWGGLALLVMVVVRATMLWIAVGRKPQTEPHTHDHGHEHHHHHDHDHDHHHEHEHAIAEGHPPHSHVHEHGVAAGAPPHAHAHDHGHSHQHGHSHDDGHTHDAAPWRYVVMLIPVLLFLLGLPNKSPGVGRSNARVDTTEDAQHYAGAALAGGANVLNNLAVAAALKLDEGLGRPVEVDVKALETAAAYPDRRKALQGQTVRVRGQFSPSPSDNVFSLVRYKMQCCAADRIKIDVTIISKYPLSEHQPPLKLNDWVEVTAKVDYRIPPGGTTYKTLLLVPQLRLIRPTEPDSNPYLE